CPELLETLRDQIKALQAVDAALSGDEASRATVAELPSSPDRRIAVEGYEILGELGHGGMGVVYKARQLKLNRILALKMILAGEHAGPIALTRFRREAEALARLGHPNLVQVYEVGEHEGRPYFSLEFVDGGSLDQRIAGRPQPPELAARLVQALAETMHAVH